MASSNNNGSISQAMAFWLIAAILLLTVHVGSGFQAFFRQLSPPQTLEKGIGLGNKGLEGTQSPMKSPDPLETEFKRMVPKVTGDIQEQNELENKGKPEEVNAKEKLPIAESGNLKNPNGNVGKNSNLEVIKPQETPRTAASTPESAKDKAKEEKKLEKEIKVLVDKNEPEVSKDAGEVCATDSICVVFLHFSMYSG
jgi:hypothetical protein